MQNARTTSCRAVSEGDINTVSWMLRDGKSPNSSSEFDFTYASALERAVGSSNSSRDYYIYSYRIRRYTVPLTRSSAADPTAMGGLMSTQRTPDEAETSLDQIFPPATLHRVVHILRYVSYFGPMIQSVSQVQ